MGSADITNHAITQIFRDEQDEFSYCCSTDKAQVAKLMQSTKVYKEAIFRFAISSFKAQ